MKLKHIRLIKKAVALSILIFLAVVLQVIKTNNYIAEYIFARGTSRAFVCVFGTLSKVFPFSIFEIIVFIAIIAVIFYLIILIKAIKRRKQYKVTKLLLNLAVIILIFINIYTLAAGGNYYRDKAKVNAYMGEQLSLEDTTAIINYFVNDYSEISSSLNYDSNSKSTCPYTYSEVSLLLMKEFDKLSRDYGKYYNAFTPKPKKAMSSFLMSYEGVSGISFLPTGESNINYQAPQCFRIVTMAHEMSHVKGVMMEREANMMAYYVLINSDIPYFRYCGYMYGLSHLTNLLYYYDVTLYEEMRSTYPVNAIKEQQGEYAFWQEKESFIEEISSFFNDIYLKLSGASDGINSYYDFSQITLPENKESEPIIYYSDTTRMLIAIANNRFL